MKQQAIEYDNLQCRFDVLTSTITNLTSVLQSHGKSNLNLEHDIMENMSLQKQCWFHLPVLKSKIPGFQAAPGSWVISKICLF